MTNKNKKTVKKRRTSKRDFKELQVQHAQQKNWKKPSEACVKCFEQILKSAAGITVVQCGSKSNKALNIIDKLQKEVLGNVQNIKVPQPKVAEYGGVDELCKKRESEISSLQKRLDTNEEEADNLEREQENYTKLLESVREKQTKEKRPWFPLLNEEFAPQVDIPDFPKESFNLPVISHVPSEFKDLYNEIEADRNKIFQITKKLENIVNKYN